MNESDYKRQVDAALSAETIIGSEDRKLVIIGLIVAGSLYLAAAFIAGLIIGNRGAWTLALVAFGFTYLCYFSQLAFPKQRDIAAALLVISIAAGLCSGICLLLV